MARAEEDADPGRYAEPSCRNPAIRPTIVDSTSEMSAIDGQASTPKVPRTCASRPPVVFASTSMVYVTPGAPPLTHTVTIVPETTTEFSVAPAGVIVAVGALEKASASPSQAAKWKVKPSVSAAYLSSNS